MTWLTFATPIDWMVVCVVLGLLVGSFLNVVIYRLPLMMERAWRQECQQTLAQRPGEEASAQEADEPFTLNRPRSHCPTCRKPVAWWQNVPVLSFILLKGRCGHCQAAISWRYPAIELLTAALSGVLAWHFGPTLALAAGLVFTWMAIACFFIDWDHHLLPDQLTLPLLWLGLLVNLNGTFVSLHSAVLGAVIGYLFFWLVYQGFKALTGKEGLGYGDFKLLAALGAWFGWSCLPLIVIVSGVLGILMALALRLGGRPLSQAIPYGPSLVIAGWLVLLWGQTWVQLYLAWIGR